MNGTGITLRYGTKNKKLLDTYVYVRTYLLYRRYFSLSFLSNPSYRSRTYGTLPYNGLAFSGFTRVNLGLLMISSFATMFLLAALSEKKNTREIKISFDLRIILWYDWIIISKTDYFSHIISLSGQK